jgi:SAM-dependent methyltransferase
MNSTSPVTLPEVVGRLSASASALAVLAAAVDARVSGVPLDPAIEPHVREVLDALGLAGAIEESPPAALATVVHQVRSFWQLDGKLMTAAGRTPGWIHTEADLLESFGAMTHNLAERLRTSIAPQLDGLLARLDGEGAAMLDVGTGVGALACELAGAFPALRIVGVDPWGPAMALARERVRRAGLSGRIELRQMGGEAVTDECAFDLAWVASPFMPEELIPRIVERVHAALRPGGWLLFAIARPSADPLAGALMRLRVRSFGGGVWLLDRCQALLGERGYAEVRELPTPPGAVAAMIAARRPV